jgi:hypothetical protein
MVGKLVRRVSQWQQLIREGKQPHGYYAPQGARPLADLATLADVRAGLLVRGIRTREDLAALKLVLDEAFNAPDPFDPNACCCPYCLGTIDW